MQAGLSSRPSEQYGRALDLTPTAALTKRVCARTGSFRSVDSFLREILSEKKLKYTGKMTVLEQLCESE